MIPIQRIEESEQGVPYNRYQPLCRRSLVVVSWLHLRSIGCPSWQRCMHFDVVRRAKQGASYQVKDLLFQSKRGL